MQTRVEYQNISGYVTQIIDHIGLVRQQVDEVYVEQQSLSKAQQEAIENIALVSNKTDQLIQKQLDSQILSKAISDLQSVKSEMKDKFGHYDLIRNRTLAIIQAGDSKIIDLDVAVSEANKANTEAFSYWLPPALLSIVRWRQGLEEKAKGSVQLANRFSKTKAALFYALLHRRESSRQRLRTGAIRYWLRQYFATQSFDALNRETILVINGLANNVFGADLKSECSELFLDRIDEYLFKDQDNYDQQVDGWYTELKESIEKEEIDHSYNSIKQKSLNWDEIEDTIHFNRHYKQLYNLFEDIFSSELHHHPDILVELDGLMFSLVKDFEEEELDYHKKIEKYETVISSLGDNTKAEKAFARRETLFEEKLDCGQLLIYSFFYPKNFRVTKGAQRLAAALLKEHLVKGLERLHNQYEADEVKEVTIKIDEWIGASVDGKNEQELVTDLESHVESLRKNALKKIEFPIKNPLIGLGIIFLAWLIGGGISWILLIGILAGGFFIFNAWRNYKSQANEVNSSYSVKMQQETNLLKKVLAEIVDLREEFSEGKSYYQKLTEIAKNIEFDSLLNKSSADRKDESDQPALDGYMSNLPEWDLMPSENILVKKKRAI